MDCLQVNGSLGIPRRSSSWNPTARPERAIQHCAKCGARHAGLWRHQCAAGGAGPAGQSALALALRILASREAARRRRQVDFRRVSATWPAV